MLAVRSVAEQLVDIYYSQEWWIRSRMHPDKALDYHYRQLEKGAIRIIMELGVVLGYYQLWKLTQEQVNRILDGKPFDENAEDITHGDIAYLANLYIDKSFRKGSVFKRLHKMFKEDTKDCTHVAGVEQKYRERIKLFKLRS